MRALVLHAARDLRLEQRPEPVPGPGEVLVRIARGGICGTDLHYFQDGGFGTIRVKAPIVLGHEVAGTVTARGEGVAGIEEGALVALHPLRPCEACSQCRRGIYNQCLDARFFGSALYTPHTDGAFSDYVVVPAENCVPAEGLTPGEAAMAEPLAVCLHAVSIAGSLVGKRVLVTGCGPIGLLTILAARRAGADEIVATDISDHVLAMARDAGADRTVNVATDREAMAQYAAHKGWFASSFECSGAPAALATAIASTAPRGVIVQLGMGGDVAVPLQSITVKELQLRGSFRFYEEYATAVSLMQKGLIDVKPLISHTVPMTEALPAFDLAADRSRAMKVHLDFS